MAQLPPGFVLDGQPQAQGAPLPPGFQLDSQPPEAAYNPTEEPSMLDQIGRQLGLTARYGLEGAGNLAGVISDPFGQFLPGYQPTGQMASGLADKIGLPSPQGELEQGVGAASKALVGQGLTMGAGSALGASELAAQPLLQAISTLAGTGGQEVAKASGAGEGVQLAAGLAGGLAPGAMSAGAPALVRGALRGKDGAKMLENLDSFKASGTTPTVGQASENRVSQFIESLLAKTPGGAGVMAKKAANQADEIGAGLSAKANALSPGADSEAAGDAILKGITGEGGFISRFRSDASKLYDEVDKFLPAQAPVEVSATKRFLADAVAPTTGAKSTSSLLINPKLKEIDAALTDDLAAAASGTLPYEAVKSLRSRVGAMVQNAGLTPDVPKAELKKLYSALSDDIKAQAGKTPEGAAAFARADNFYRTGMEKIDKIEHVVKRAGGPEKIFAAAMSGNKEGATTLNNVMSGLKASERDVVTAAVLNRMGKATAGQQGVDADGMADRFSTSTFLTNWANMSKQARQVLFDHKGPQFRDDMNKLAQVATNLRDGSKVFANNSGSSQGAAQLGTSAAFVMSALTGNVGTAGTIAAGAGAANLGARLMTNPKFVNWLAKQTNRPVGALPGQIGMLANIGKDDPDIQEFAAQLRN